MTYFKNILIMVALIAVTVAQYHYVPVQQEYVPVEHHIEEYHHAHPKYEFKYGVKDEHTHDIKEQAEKRDGDKVEGYYKLVEPDGTTRTVHYTADKKTGFHAQVVKSGHAIHPVYQPVHQAVHIPLQYH